MESHTTLYDRAYEVGGAAYSEQRALSNPFFNPVMRQGYEDGYFGRAKTYESAAQLVTKPAPAQVEADESVQDEYTLTRSQILGCVEHAINSLAKHQGVYLQDNEKYRIRNAASTVSRVAYGHWWDADEKCGCIIGAVYGADAVERASEAERRFGLRFDSLLADEMHRTYGEEEFLNEDDEEQLPSVITVID